MSTDKYKLSDSQREVLISEVQSRRCLWDDRHPDYKKREVVEKLWKEIGYHLGLPGGVTKIKWKNLKDKFRIENNKIPKYKSGAENVEYKSKWPFFNSMQFLKDVLEPNTMSGNLPPSNEGNKNNDKDNEDYDELVGDSFEEPFSPPTPSIAHSTSRPSSQATHSSNKRKSQHDIDMMYLDIEREKLNLCRSNQERETSLHKKPEYHFFMSLIPYMEALDPVDNLEVRGKIQNIILDAYKKKHTSQQSSNFTASHDETINNMDSNTEFQTLISYTLNN